MTPGSARLRSEPVRLEAAELPGCLRDLSHPPAALWCLGDPKAIPGSPEEMVAIVGTRECSQYGERTARRLATAAVKAGLTVVSGLARGVDAAAHRAAMEAGGTTLAVNGPGVDVAYPVSHRALHEAIQERGAVLSEMEPGTKAFPGCFPRRNRIIAALAKVTVVVEGGFRSGAINTATRALELGRIVAAVPGPIDDPRSAGANLLIRDGALVITDVDDLLMACGLSTSGGGGRRGAEGSVASPAGSELTDLDGRILQMLVPRATPVSDLAFQLGVPVGQISGSLLRLEIAGLAGRDGGGYFLRSR